MFTVCVILLFDVPSLCHRTFFYCDYHDVGYAAIITEMEM